MATTVVMILAYSILAIYVVVMSAVSAYVDSVYLYELRASTRQNLYSCLSKVELMLSHDFFLRGTTNLSEFDCAVDIENNGTIVPPSSIILSATARLGSVVMRADEVIDLEDFDIKVESRVVED